MRVMMNKAVIIILITSFLIGCSLKESKNNITNNPLKIATFNVSMDATNYVGRDTALATNQVLKEQLKNGNQQIKNIAEIIQRTRPDIILLNEFDYIKDPKDGVELFIKNYLNVSQSNNYA